MKPSHVRARILKDHEALRRHLMVLEAAIEAMLADSTKLPKVAELAGELIIDLVRFAALEKRRGACGPMRHLAFFFKDPLEVDVHDLAGQWEMLVRHVAPTTSTNDVKLRSRIRTRGHKAHLRDAPICRMPGPDS